MAAARRRVHLAKVALGERGRAWWLTLEAGANTERPRADLETMLHARPNAPVFISELAQIVGGSSRRSAVREIRTLVLAWRDLHFVEVTQHGKVIEGDWKGRVRITRFHSKR